MIGGNGDIRLNRLYVLIMQSVFILEEISMFERIKVYWQKRRYERERKKFIRKWNEDNKNWCECRHKRKAFKRAMTKNGYTM